MQLWPVTPPEAGLDELFLSSLLADAASPSTGPKLIIRYIPRNVCVLCIVEFGLPDVPVDGEYCAYLHDQP